MQSRRDQVQAYFFEVGRLVSAVVHGRPDALQQPNKRLNTGMFLGMIAAGVVMGIFGIYGLFVPGGDTSWRHAGAIVMNKTTGARYVYLDDHLRPVLNFASAKLVAGKAGGQVFSVSENSLAGTPVGQPIGISGAPDALPSTLDTGVWTVCTRSPGTEVDLLLNRPVDVALSDAQAMLVVGPDQVKYLVWRGKRHRIPNQSAVEALGYGGIAPIAVNAAWLNTLHQAKDMAVPDTPGAGGTGVTIDGRQSTVGQIYQVRNPAINSDQLYLVRSDGVVALSRTAAALLLAAPGTKAAYSGSRVELIQVGPAALAGVPNSTSGPNLMADLPQAPPEIVNPSSSAAACVGIPPQGKGDAEVTVGLLPVNVVTGMPLALHPAGAAADRISIPAGHGVLAKEVAAPGANPGATYLITETGTKYPLASPEVATALGYSDGSAVSVPAELLALLPRGPVLSTEGALKVQAPAT
ncbi:type VII secretion protein EccB [Amycolatopsis jejuensis]|uniref:type VII secretion protein EccB n=1 Tax=Amycolatopsis jejuensis TaxID=330084 RepID=UPI000524F7AB|nr:type VII secretion protein EccB [Amycolatopsis jejuensis]